MKKCVCLILILLVIFRVDAAKYYIDDVSTHGEGSTSNPFNDFSQLKYSLKAGDTLLVMPGNYNITEPLWFRNNGTINEPIVIQAYDPENRPFITGQTMIIRIENDNQIYDGLIMDAQYVNDVGIVIKAVNNIVIRNCIFRRSLRDGLSIWTSHNTEIDGCEIYYCLRGDALNKEDAHGIVAYHSTNTTIRNCNIHHVSGDCFQIDPTKEPPLWDSVLIENCKLWAGIFEQDEAGFHIGEDTGENAIDTKTDPNQDYSYRPIIIIVNVEAYGFLNKNGQMVEHDRSAFNIKHNVKVIIANCILHDNDIAYRLSGPYSWNGETFGGAHVTMTNCIGYNNLKNVWLERQIAYAHLYNCTFDKRDTYQTDQNGLPVLDVHFYYKNDGYNPNGLDIKNCVFVDSKPPEASDPSNIVAEPSDFRNYNFHEYYSSANSLIIDKGIDLEEVTADISGYPRPGGSYDSGAYEYRGPLNENPKSSNIFLNPVNESLNYIVYPNPTTDIINLKSSSLLIDTIVTVSVFNTMGVNVITLSPPFYFDSEVLLNVSSLARGMYFLRVTFYNENISVCMKFMKM